MEPIISIEHVTFRYADAADPALVDIDLSISEGSVVGVVAAAGAGKSTLAALLSGAAPHHYAGEFFGAVRIAGADTCDVSLTDISRTVASVSQDIDAQMVASVVEDEILFGLENFGVPHDEIEGRLVSALENVGIADLRDREIATLSGGQKQKVAIAAALALRPRVLVLDEPTAALDPVSSRSVFETLRRVNRDHGVTVIVIEQAVALLSAYCDRVVVLDHGRVALDGGPREVFAQGTRLRRIGVDSPRCARISNSLAAEGILEDPFPALDVASALAQIDRILRAHGVEPEPRATGAARPRVRTAAGAGEPGPAPRPAVLELSGVDFRYPAGGAGVSDLALTVRAGEIMGVVGQNGAGKTTLTKLVNGLLKPSRGSVVAAGMDTASVPVSKLATRVATLFQNPDRQLCQNTVLDEVAFGLMLHGTPRDEALERARAVIDRFGLPAAEAPFSLSRGQRQLVALASTVVLDPALVILDEPTSGLDYRECMTVMGTVREMAERGCGVLMVCHDMEVVSDFADRIAVMADGRMLACGPSHEIFSDADLMARASIAPPNVIDLAARLAAEGYTAFAGIEEVSGIVYTVKELIFHD